MNIHEKEARRLRILKAIYELSEDKLTKTIRLKDLTEILTDIDPDYINEVLLYFREKGIIDGPTPISRMGVSFVLSFQISSYGIDIIESALKGKAKDDFSNESIKIFINNVTSNTSNIIQDSQNVNVTISNDIHNEIMEFLKKIKSELESNNIKNDELKDLVDLAIDSIKANNIDDTKVKKFLKLIVSIGGSVVANFLTDGIKLFLN